VFAKKSKMSGYDLKGRGFQPRRPLPLNYGTAESRAPSKLQRLTALPI
jgi:hypothetical protein